MKRYIPFILLLALLILPTALADGCYIPPTNYEGDILEPEQKAIIFWDGTVEKLILQVSFEGEMDEFAWIVPVPSYPTLDQSTARLFIELYSITAPLYRRSGMSKGFGMMGTGKMDEAGITVHEEKQVGIYQTATLSAENPEALIEWLNENEYQVPEKLSPLMDFYIEKDWYFVAMRISVDDIYTQDMMQSRDWIANIEPLQLSFETDTMVYPLKITSLNGGETEVLLYTFAPYKTNSMNIDGFEEEFGSFVDKIEYNLLSRVADESYYPYDNYYSYYPHYSEEDISEVDFTWLEELSSGEFFLTKLRGKLTAQDMVDDLILGQADNNDEYRMEVREDNYYLNVILNVIVGLLFILFVYGFSLFFLFLAYVLLRVANNLLIRRNKESPFYLNLKRTFAYAGIACVYVLFDYFWSYGADIVGPILIFIPIHLIWSGIVALRKKKQKQA